MQHAENLSFRLLVISRRCRETQDIGRSVLICMDKLCLLLELFVGIIAWKLVPLWLCLWN